MLGLTVLIDISVTFIVYNVWMTECVSVCARVWMQLRTVFVVTFISIGEIKFIFAFWATLYSTMNGIQLKEWHTQKYETTIKTYKQQIG